MKLDEFEKLFGEIHATYVGYKLYQILAIERRYIEDEEALAESREYKD